MPESFDTSFDRDAEYPTPWGQGKIEQCGVWKGQCWDDSLHFSHDEVTKIAQCVMDKFDKNGVAVNFMWTARNEIEERWSYPGSWDAGWINQTAVNVTTLMKSRSYRASYATQEEGKDGEMKLNFLQ